MTGTITPRRIAVIALLLIAAAGFTPAVAAEPTCAGKPVPSPGTSTHSLRIGETTRTYRVYVPPRHSARTPVPVVLAFHGGLGTGKSMEKQTRLDAVADAHGFLAVYPDGLYRTWNAGGCCEKSMEEHVDDVGFVSALMDRLAADYCVDPRRIYATGFSNGAMLAHRLACELADRIAAIAPVSGVIMVSSCVPARPVPVMVFHGTADPRSLWEGGLGAKDPRKGTRASIPDTMATLESRLHCAQQTSTIYQKGAATCTSRPICDGGAEVALCRIEGGGHQWPGGEPVFPGMLGPTTQDISAGEVMWRFFERHPLPASARN